jgi:NTP pyrophosphatase (non-canonical NTP hydrolase)
MDKTFGKRVAEWAEARNLILGSTPLKQMEKLDEELGELEDGLENNDLYLIKDSIGDACVVLAVMAAQLGVDFEECLELAWHEIKDRKGSMQNGIFVKEESNGS